MTHSESKRKKNEEFFQDINKDLNDSLMSTIDEFAQRLINGHFVCECSDMTCTKIINLTPNAYQAATKKKNHYVVIPGHEQSDIEDVVDDSHDSYWIVKKTLTGE